MRIAVLALQGAFLEHEQMLNRLGVETFEVRQLSDWNQPKDGLIIPGGESTTMRKLLHELGLFDVIRKDIVDGLPVFGTCAGLILLAKEECQASDVRSTTSESPFPTLGTMDIEVVRNAYGRQLGSFRGEAPFDFSVPFSDGDLSSLPPHVSPLVMTFIRAPYVNRVLDDGCRVLAEVDGRIVAVRQANQLVTAFHPELDADTRVHEYFIGMCNNKRSSTHCG